MTTNDIADAIAEFSSEIAAESNSTPEETQPVEEVAEAEDVEETVEASESEGVEAAEEEATEVAEEEAEPELPTVEYVKADGKKIKIDYSDRDHIKRVYQKFAAQTRYQSERDSYKSQLDEVQAKYSKQDEMIALLNENIEDPAEMYRLFTGGKDLKELFKEWQKEEDQFALLSDAEKKAYLDAKRLDARQKEMDKREAAMNRKLEETAKKEDNAKLEQQQALVTSSFEKYRFNEVEDADEAFSLDRRLWNDIKSRLAEYETINKEIIDKEMKDAADELRSLLGRRSRVEEKKVVKKKKVEAKKAAAKAVTPENEDSTGFIDNLASLMGL